MCCVVRATCYAAQRRHRPDAGPREGEVVGRGQRRGAARAHLFPFFAGEWLRNPGEKLAALRDGVAVDVLRAPLGVVGLIRSWNFPSACPAWKTALAAGHAVLLKPAGLTPGCAHVLAEILVQAGCPAGVFKLVTGAGLVIGQALVDSTEIAAISFTGSERVGRGIAIGCAQGLKKVQL